METPCTFCGGAWHPACGHVYSATARACKRCTLEAFEMVSGWTNRKVGKKRRDGTLRVQTALTFYEAAVLFPPQPR